MDLVAERASSRRRLLWRLAFVVVVAAIATACASIMGVDDPVLVDPNADQDGAVGTDDAGDPNNNVDGSVGGEDAGCSGEGCPCSDVAPCVDPVFNKCISGVCGECTTAPDSCGTGRYCLAASHECTPGCKSDDECKTLATNAPLCHPTRHQCVACLTKAECPAANQDCSPAGICADKCVPLPDGGPESCGPGKLCCGGLCVDPSSDLFNCKSCGVVCTGGTPACCASSCVDTQKSVANCGGCGMQCVTLNAASTSCSAGTCRWNCNNDYDHCLTGNTGCETKTSDNPLQCGSCTTNCNTTVLNATGIGCSNSRCTFTCNANFANCDGLSTNGCECACGAKDQACCGGQKCSSSNLVCSQGKCRSCGQKDQPCCSGGQCVSGTRCLNGTCKSCKSSGDSCNQSSECCSNDCKSNNKCN